MASASGVSAQEKFRVASGGFSTAVHAINAGTYQFAYVFRLKESVDTPGNLGEWLTTEGLDLRRSRLPAEAFVFGPNGDSPDSKPQPIQREAVYIRLLRFMVVVL